MSFRFATGQEMVGEKAGNFILAGKKGDFEEKSGKIEIIYFN